MEKKQGEPALRETTNMHFAGQSWRIDKLN